MLDEHTWQGILVGYDLTNQYWILNPWTSKVHIRQDVHFDELHTYDKKELLPADFEDKEWAPDDDKLFVNLTQL